MEQREVPEETAALLRTEVRRFVTECGTRRALPTRLYVGRPGGDRTEVPVEATYDDGLRVDLLTRALDGLVDPGLLCGWLTRGGFPTACDEDLLWLAAADRAFGRHGAARVPFFAVTRRGWLDVRTGESRAWQRVRPLRA